MSFEITTAFVQQFKSNVMMLSQQKGSRLENAVMREPITGKWGFVDQIGQTNTIKRTSRHSDSPLVSTPHERRRIDLDSEEWGDLVDDADKVRTLIDPTNAYAVNAGWAFGRAKDDHIIDAFFADASTGETGSTTVSFPTTNVVAVSFFTGSNQDLNVRKVREAIRILKSNDVDEDEQWYIAVTSRQLDSMLGETEVTSSDFNSVKALVDGNINDFLGLKWIRTERLNTDANGFRRIPVWSKSGMALGVGRDVKTRISERADKSYSTYVYLAMDVGASRVEEEKVVEIKCDESAAVSSS